MINNDNNMSLSNNMQPKDYNNSPNKGENTKLRFINSFSVIAPFYSLRREAINKALSVNISSLHNARVTSIILAHLGAYTKTVKTTIHYLYGFGDNVIHKSINVLLEKGYITTISDKRKTNIDAYVSFTAYRITSLGKLKLNELNELMYNTLVKTGKSDILQ